MSDDPILAAIEAAKHADAIMRRTAGGGPLPDPESAAGLNHPAYQEPQTSGPEITRIPPDEPHDEWRPRHGDLDHLQWHPPYGETHVKYHVYPIRGGGAGSFSGKPKFYRANSHGIYLGMHALHDPGGRRPSIEMPKYSNEDEPERVLNENGSHPLNFRSLNEAQSAAEAHYAENYGQPPKHDYDIDSIINEHQPPAGGRRGLGDDEDYSHIFDAVRKAIREARLALRRTAAHEHVESGQRGRPDWTGCAHPECRPDLPTTMYHVSHPDNRDSIAQHGLLASYSQDDDESDELGMPHGIYMTSDEPKPSHDTERWPGDVWAIDTTKLKHLENDFPGGMLFRNAYATKYDVPPGAMRLHRPSAHRTAGLHARMAARADAVSESVRMRIAAELSPPCPDCGQVAGFEPHMVSPRVKACRNCGWTMTDYGVDDLLADTLRGHDREVSDLPETDHPDLGKHGARKPKNPFGSDPRFSHQTTCNVCGQDIYGDPREIEDRNPKSEWVDRTGDTGADETEHVRAHDHWPVDLA